MSRRALLVVFHVVSFVSVAAAADVAAGRVSFNRDIRPIMSDTCFHCHGFDAKSREANLRLDLREQALKPAKSGGIPIVPGKPEESEIILRITDTSEPMPPEKAHKKLTAAQVDLLRRWVAEGAVYEPHWAYAPLAKPTVPNVPTRATWSGRMDNPIDAFIREKLASKKITPSPEADRARLLRRLTLDLTGLPPTPAETATFVADRTRSAYERQVEQLLASPRHGERMAVWWLDIARFTDTVGFHGDQNQRIFPYRDYVIGAFNTNKRFDQFTIEQLAGDLLPNPTTEQRVATGYNRLNMMTREGGAQPAEYLAKYGAERVRGVAAAWFGSTFGCAECHDHKFDPIKTRDFYELQSFFADMKQWGVYSDYGYTKNPELAGFNNDFPFPPEIKVTSPYLVARQQRVEAELGAERRAVLAAVRAPELAEKFSAWQQQTRDYLARHSSRWSELPVVPEDKAQASMPVAKKNSAAAKRGAAPRRIVVRPEPGPIMTISLELKGTEPEKTAGGARANRTPLRLAAAVRDAAGKERKLDFVFADGSPSEPRYTAGAEVVGILGGWKYFLPDKSGQARGSWLLSAPLTFVAGDTLVLSLSGDAPTDVRVFTTPLGATDPFESGSFAVADALKKDPSARTPQETELLANTWLLSTAGDRAAFERQHKLAAALRELRGGKTWTMVTEAVAPMAIRVLPRGNWQDLSGPVVTPATPSFLPGRIESAPDKRLTRLDLARWIVSRDNPITARAVMNRLWAMYFGVGLSASVDDLGSQGELPSHPELLDWLASEFRDSGWDLRHMIRLIVTSATYRQSSTARPELRETDPANRLLAAQNPRRLEAEFVRDNALFVAGLLDLRDIGGPSTKPYQPAGYYAALQFPDRDYVASATDGQWRRGVYTHWQRTFLHPMLANFDAPARDECAAARMVSNTPQQALTLLNDPTFVEAARNLAGRIVTTGGADDTARLRTAFSLALARAPKLAEVTSLTAFLKTQRDTYRAAPADADKLLRIGLSPPHPGDAVELAAWTTLARVLLNSQEVITRY